LHADVTSAPFRPPTADRRVLEFPTRRTIVPTQRLALFADESVRLFTN
jgi:hypothetical protein